MQVKLRARTFLILALGIVVALCATYFFGFLYQIGSHVKAEWWLKNAYIYKEYVAASIEDKKIIIVSGSNSLFSVDSRVVEGQTGMRVVNLSGHAGLGLDFHFYKIKDHISEGDIVILPLEYNYYINAGHTQWEANNYMAWGWEDYLSRLSWIELINFIIDVPKQRLLEGVFKQKGMNPVLDQAAVVRQVTDAQSSNVTRWNGYSHTSLNYYGDMLVDARPTEKLLEDYANGFGYYALAKKPSEEFFESYSKIKSVIEASKAHLMLTWPVTIRNSKYDLTIDKYQQLTTGLKEALAERGVMIRCNPALFHMDIDFFFNTMYHTNKTGAYIRSVNLATCLNNLLESPEYTGMDYSTANRLVQQQQFEAQESNKSSL